MYLGPEQRLRRRLLMAVAETSTTSPSKPKAKPRKPVSKASVAKAAKEAGPQWASSGSLPLKPYKDIVLTELGQKVRVRFLSTVESAAMAILPDLAKFSELMSKEFFRKDGEDPDPQDARDIMSERVKYMGLCCHLCVMDTAGGMDETCDCGLAPHPKSLWTKEQVSYLSQLDMMEVCRAAERTDVLEQVRPFSQDDTPSSTEPSANTGESTQE